MMVTSPISLSSPFTACEKKNRKPCGVTRKIIWTAINSEESEISEVAHQKNQCQVVYICHPDRSDPAHNAASVRRICRRLATAGYLLIAPQIYLPGLLDETRERKLAMDLCLRLLATAGEVWIFGEPTDGMRIEIAEAERLSIPVFEGDTL